MSNLASEYFQKQAMMRKLQEDLSRLQENEELEGEVAFKQELDALLDKYQKSYKDAMIALDPFYGQHDRAEPVQERGRVRKKRVLKVYKHPETGEIVETRGGNHKTLKAWKDEHGSEAVESWVIETKE